MQTCQVEDKEGQTVGNRKIERTEEQCGEIKRGETLAGQDKECDYAPRAEEEKKGV